MQKGVHEIKYLQNHTTIVPLWWDFTDFAKHTWNAYFICQN